jgi:N-glycosylase/DNA lyase
MGKTRTSDPRPLAELLAEYENLRDIIKARLAEFRLVWETGSDEDIFAELAFCLFTPQSKAKSCWGAVQSLCEEGLLHCAAPEVMAQRLCTRVRFHHTKARNVAAARELFRRDGKLRIREVLSSFAGAREAREELVAKVRGLGYKEASHFLRNIGWGEELAILDRHILRNLAALGVIGEVPTSLSRRKYLEIEEALLGFCRKVGLRPDHFDMLLWARQTGEVFK